MGKAHQQEGFGAAGGAPHAVGLPETARVVLSHEGGTTRAGRATAEKCMKAHMGLAVRPGPSRLDAHLHLAAEPQNLHD
jgi:hypothetical protein